MSERGMGHERWYLPPSPNPSRDVVVIGAGLAGCSISHALSQRGLRVQLLDSASSVASAASGNPRAIYRPHVTRAKSLLNHFNQDAFTQLLHMLDRLSKNNLALEYQQLGVLQLLEKLGEWPDLHTGDPLDAASASALAGVDLGCPALHFPEAGWLNARSFCQALIKSSTRITLNHSTKVKGITRETDGWRLHCESLSDSSAKNGNFHTIKSPLVVFATGASTGLFDFLNFLNLTVSVGQTTRCRYLHGAPRSRTILAGKRFLIPEGDQCTIGATHWNEANCGKPLDLMPDDADNETNLRACSALHTELATHLAPIDQWRAFRVSTPDRLPVVGAVPDNAFYKDAYADLRHGQNHTQWLKARYLEGLYIISGLGSRGLSTVTLAAQLLTDTITGTTDDSTEYSLPYQQLLHPARFIIRQLKRQTISG